MSENAQAKEAELAKLEEELKDLKKTFPEHCYGTKGFTCAHRATPQHYQRIEDVEERIQQLKAELGR